MVAVACFISFDLLVPVDKTNKDVLPGSRIASAVGIFVGVWSAQIVGLMSVHMPSELKLELFPLVTSLISGLALSCLGIVVRTQLDVRRMHLNTPERRLLGLAPFAVATIISGELLKHASRIDFANSHTSWSIVASYGIFFLFVILTGLLVDKARTFKRYSHSTAIRALAALVLATGMYLAQSIYFKNLTDVKPSAVGHTLSAVALGDIGVAIVGAFVAVIATWMLMKLLQGRLDARVRETSEQFQKMSDTDSLTGLPNRRCFQASMDELSAKGSEPAALFFLDLDGFKPINDNYGHAVGDQVLRVVASRLRGVAGKSGLVARLGGDEFVVLSSGTLAKSGLELQASAFIKAVSAPIQVGQHEVKVTTSVGIAVAPDDVALDKLMASADAAMYRAKRSGKNQFRFYSPAMDDESSEMVGLQREMKEGLDKNQFELRVCPQFDGQGRRVVAVETLLYWNHPTRGLLAPAEFLDDAQRMSLGQKFVKWLLPEVAKVQHALGDAGKNIRVSVNFGPLLVKQHQFVGLLRIALAESGLQSRNLSFSLRESMVPVETGPAESLVHILRGLGIEVTLDDYGTGNVGVAGLRRIGFSRVRIATEYIEHALVESPPGRLLRAMIAMLKALGFAVSVRGVSTAEHLALVRTLEADEVQGDVLGRPVPVQEMLSAVDINSTF